MATSYSALPSLIQQSTLATIAWPCDVTAQAGAGAPTSPSTVFLDLTTGTTVVLADRPTISGNVISQIVRGSVLTAGHSYRLSFLYTIAGNMLDSEVTLNCPD